MRPPVPPDPEFGPPRIIPAPPRADDELGEIRWRDWKALPVVTHIDPSCEVCAYPGPLSAAFGLTLHQDRPYRKLLKRSRVADGQRPVWGPVVQPEPRWVITHNAVRCQACDEMRVWRMTGGTARPGDWVEIHHFRARSGQAVTRKPASPPQADTLW